MRKRFGLTAGLLVLALAAGGPARGQEEELEILAVTAGELSRAFDENELAAGVKYYDRALRITGKVNWISTTFKNVPQVSFAYDSGSGERLILKRVQVYFSPDQTGDLTEALMKMVGGEEWVTECQMVERSYTDPLPGTCSVQ